MLSCNVLAQAGSVFLVIIALVALIGLAMCDYRLRRIDGKLSRLLKIAETLDFPRGS